MKKYFLILLLSLLLINCAIWYPCNVVELQIEKSKILVHYDTTLLDTSRLIKDTKKLYYWKIKECNCFEGMRKRK